ncbi:MAG TPA: hypothetical protein VFQ45_20965 [Longimicrobium sp.]|nr:hypothetical protein [Longimicrobium sp.]
MARRPNYGFEKRQRELDKQKKKEARKAAADAGEEPPDNVEVMELPDGGGGG